jgi:D-lactate dehydrogenase (cytochrome)
MDFLLEEHGADGIELMARIKRAFDPLNILNPGKVLRV